jgi:hypothetical protein
MALERRAAGWRPRDGSESAGHCSHCGIALGGYGFNFACHICGARYCYAHLRRHDRAHPKAALEAAVQ